MHDMERMRSGQWYIAGEEAAARHREVRELIREFNGLANTDLGRSRELLRGLFPHGETPNIWPPLHLEFGVNTRFGDGCFMNFNCTILDITEVTIDARTLFGPGCQLITVEHPVADHVKRAEGWERARPIRIGEDCWFGAGVIVLPGVTVGDRVVVAAGSVVTSERSQLLEVRTGDVDRWDRHQPTMCRAIDSLTCSMNARDAGLGLKEPHATYSARQGPASCR